MLRFFSFLFTGASVKEITDIFHRCDIKPHECLANKNKIKTLQTAVSTDIIECASMPIIRCQFCGFSYRTQQLLQKHLIKKHKK